jgi:hypothetical protein
MFTSCHHLGSHPDLPDTIVKGDHPRTIVTKFDSSLHRGCREDLWMCFSRGSNVNFSSPCRSCWFGHRPPGRNFERGPSTEHCDEIRFQLIQYFVRRRSLNVFPHRVLWKINFPAGSHLGSDPDLPEKFGKGIIQELLWPSLVSIDQVVSAEKNWMYFP